ncbi:protein of unknown function [Marinococcus luteus]|uniref:DUF4260 domain-containing protein n=1 Tax=Marinococcus luteus TaxID=1122204 RepID=A0A1H2QL59_9BACI|nr:DUF4260 family protein [Marinococcus luteus]SDW07159.1 protein of unknown function [Marinococcus luteus]
MNQRLIKAEGFMFAVLAAVLYFSNGYSWLLFLLLLFLPDVSMIGYAVSSKTGAYVYNAAHTYILPLLLLLSGYLLSIEWPVLISFIWIVHIGLDRMLGFGLKYTSDFKDTHIQKL